MKTKIILLIAFIFLNKALYSQLNPIVEHKIDSIISLMTPDEKIGQLSQYSGNFINGKNVLIDQQIELVRKGLVGSFLNITGTKTIKDIQKIAMTETRMKIPILFGLDVIHGYKTIFPVPLAEACSWDPELVEKSAKISAIEAGSSGIHWTFAPMVDIARDPRWGRIVEGSGEDTYLGSIMAKARVKGFQGDLSTNANILSCPKHYAAYGGAEGGRDYNTVDISERTLREVYLPPYKAAIEEKAATIMCSFNEIDGIPSSSNKKLLNDILRNEFKFDGFVVSDWNSIGETINHGIAANGEEAAFLSLNAGVDMDMEGKIYRDNLANLIEKKKISTDLINKSVRRILREKFSLGLFENPYKYCDEELEKSSILNSKNIGIARDVAKRSIVLLKNENELLPLSKTPKSIAIIGPLANSKIDPLGAWRALGDPKDVVSVLEGIKKQVSKSTKIFYSKGCEINSKEKEDFSEALNIAKKSDIIIAVIGESENMSGEAASRSSLDLPGNQLEMLKELKSIGKPIIVILMNGRPLSITWIDENIPAILETWYLGIQCGNAIADVLFGDYVPSGKLVVTFPRSVGQVPYYYNHKNTGRPAVDKENKFTSKYIDIENKPLYPFGFGLSYTKFEYSNLKIDKKKINKNEGISVTVDIKNIGKRNGEEIVQLYIRDESGSVTRPILELKDFVKISLNAGEVKNVKFNITPEKLSMYDKNMNYIVEPGTFKVFVGKNSSDLLEEFFEVIE